MRLLRDVREGTMVLLLLELTQHRHTRLKGLADKLGVTVAGVSEYVKSMQASGLVVRSRGEYRATKEGVKFLQERIVSLRDFVDASVRGMAIVDHTVAIAGQGLNPEERVGLFMEDGSLVARKRASPSRGTVASRAARGELVRIRDLEGIVDLTPGRIAIARIPSPGTRAAVAAKAGRLHRKVQPDLVAALGVEGEALAARMRVNVVRFAAVAASIEAAQRGLDVLLLCPEDRVGEVVSAIELANERTEDKIPYEAVVLA